MSQAWTDIGDRIPEPAGRLMAMAAGGSLGTLARYGVERTLAAPVSELPWATFTINVVGSFALGLIVTLVVERWPPSRFIRPFAAIGVCGGFTTFSTMTVEAVQRGQHGRVGLALMYLVISLLAGLLAVVLGMAAARGRFRPLPIDRSVPDPDDLGMLYVDPAQAASRAEPVGDETESGNETESIEGETERAPS